MLNFIADVDLPWVYNNTISDVNLCLQEYGEYRLWKDPGVCVWDNQAPKLLFDSGKKSKNLWNHFNSSLHTCWYTESWCSCGKCKFESRFHHFIIQFPFIILFFLSPLHYSINIRKPLKRLCKTVIHDNFSIVLIWYFLKLVQICWVFVYSKHANAIFFS